MSGTEGILVILPDLYFKSLVLSLIFLITELFLCIFIHHHGLDNFPAYSGSKCRTFWHWSIVVGCCILIILKIYLSVSSVVFLDFFYLLDYIWEGFLYSQIFNFHLLSPCCLALLHVYIFVLLYHVYIFLVIC